MTVTFFSPDYEWPIREKTLKRMHTRSESVHIHTEYFHSLKCMHTRSENVHIHTEDVLIPCRDHKLTTSIWGQH